jgi:hypothetical protein
MFPFLLVMQADLESLNIDSAAVGTLSPADSVSVHEADAAPENLSQEVQRLRARLQQQGQELLQERHRVQALQQQLALAQLAAEGAREVRLLEEAACSSPHAYDAPKLRFGDFDEGLLLSMSSVKQEQQQQQQQQLKHQGRHHGGSSTISVFSVLTGGSHGVEILEGAAGQTEGGCSVLSTASCGSSHVRGLRLLFESAQAAAAGWSECSKAE